MSFYTDSSKCQDCVQGHLSGEVLIGADTPFPSKAPDGTALIGGGPYPRFVDTGCDYAAGASVATVLLS